MAIVAVPFLLSDLETIRGTPLQSFVLGPYKFLRSVSADLDGKVLFLLKILNKCPLYGFLSKRKTSLHTLQSLILISIEESFCQTDSNVVKEIAELASECAIRHLGAL